MTSLKQSVKDVELASGATTVGIASAARMKDGPSSADPTYVMESAQSVIAYSIAYDNNLLEAFMAKRALRPFLEHKKATESLLYDVGDAIAAHLVENGHEAVVVSINAVYRPEPGVKDPSEAVAMIPDFSHRYAAVAAGLGRIGWSGNIMTPEHGAACTLCSVITTAVLDEDPLLEENPCDMCMNCVRSCPSEMIPRQENITIRMFGLEDRIAEKRTNNACYMACTDYHGLSPDGKWSNWSPFRVGGGLPKDDKELDSLCTTVRKKDPYNDAFFFTYPSYKDFIQDPDMLLYSPCGYCAYLCNGPPVKRHRMRKLIETSGFTVLRVNGTRDVVSDAEEIVEVDTPLGSRIALVREEFDAVMRGDMKVVTDVTDNPRDQIVLEMLDDMAKNAVQKSGRRSLASAGS